MKMAMCWKGSIYPTCENSPRKRSRPGDLGRSGVAISCSQKARLEEAIGVRHTRLIWEAPVGKEVRMDAEVAGQARSTWRAVGGLFLR